MAILNTRIIQKHDSQANWDKATTFVPKAGEIIVYDADATNTKPRIKIGNGTSSVSALPFITNDSDIINMIKDLDFSEPTSSGTSTTFIATLSQTDGVITATKKSVPTANGTTLGMVKSGGDVTISSGVITVKDDSHNHVISNVDGLQDALDAKATPADITNAIANLDASDPTASGTSTSFISTVSQADGVITATKATVPTANGTTLGMVKGGGDVTIASGVITVNDDSHNHVISNIDNLQSTLDAKATPADITAAIQALDYSGATASGNSTSFITQVTQGDGVISATKASIPIATSSQAGLVKSGTDITVDSSGNVSVKDNSHAHTSANISDLSTTINSAVTAAIQELDASDPAASGTATSFISSISQKDGVIVATKANITAAALGLSGAMRFLGTSATVISDGSTANPITIGYTSTDVSAGNVVLYGSKEFVWTGSAWEELGNEGSYKVQQTAVSSPSASGNATAFIDSISQNAQGVITATKKNVQFPTLSGGSAAAADATVVGGVTVSGHAVTVGKKTLTAGNNVTITGATDKITIAATDTTYSAASQSAAGLMSAADKKKLDGIATGATANTGDITGVTAGVGLDGGATSGNATVKAKLRSETALTNDSTAATETSGRVYPVAVDKSGYLAVNVPWTDTDTQYTLPTASSSTLGGVKIGSNISISSGKISVPAASGTTAGVTIVYPAASCTTFSSDSGTVTPLAVQKGAKMFAITRPTSSTTNAITRYSNTTGDVQDSKIIIEDVTNTKDTSKKAQVIAIPAEGGKKMVYGYCTDQVDGTSFIGGVFDASATSYPYSEGLAIGGTSGNLLWKAKRVLTADDLYTLPTAGSTLGGVKTTSTVTSTSGLTACPIISGVVYYKNTTYSAASQSAAGLMSAADKTKLDGIAAGANNYTYTLPNATSSTLGGVKIGSNITVSSGTISLTKSNVTSALGYTPPTSDTVYTHPTYTSKSSGLYKITVDSTGHVSAATAVQKSDITALGIPAQDTTYTLPNATSSVLGGVKIGSNITVSSGTISLTKSNVTTALGYTPPTTDTVYTHPTYTSKSSGLYKITVDSTGHISATAAVAKSDITALGIPAQDTTYTLPTASSSTLGGVKIGTGIAISSGVISNSGVRSISTGTANGTISVNTNGTSANVAVKGLGSNAYTSTAYLPMTGGTLSGNLTVEKASGSVIVSVNNTTIGKINLQVSDSGNKGIYDSTNDKWLIYSGSDNVTKVPSNQTIGTAAVRNIKVITPSTSVTAGTTSIPTGEIWMRYEG